jgi:hypothetical protein
MKHVLAIIALSVIGLALAFGQGIGGKAAIGGKAGVGGGPSGGNAAPVFNALGPDCAFNGSTACTGQSMTVSSGHLIVGVMYETGSAGGTPTFVDSNSDSFTCLTAETEPTSGRIAQICFGVAGAAITTVGATVSGYTGGSVGFNWFDYTNPAGLTTGTIQDGAVSGAANQDVTAWTTGATGSNANATDLCFAFMYVNTGTWSAPNFTNRSATAAFSSILAGDHTTSATGTFTGTATLSAAGYGPGTAVCFK